MNSLGKNTINKSAYIKKYLCFDIGGTKIKYGIISEVGEILFKDSIDSDARISGGIGILSKIINLTKSMKNYYELSGVAVSTHGMIDSDTGTVMYADKHLIPDYTGINMKKIVEKETSLTCEVENDVNCAGLGELWKGDEIRSKFVSMITIGTGIGACLINEGKLLTGDSMCAGEIGKIIIPGGHFEDLASTYSLTSNLERKLNLKPGSLDGKIIFEKIAEGDKVFIEEVYKIIENIAIGISTLSYIYNPGTIILGGGIMSREDYFKPRIKDALSRYLNPLILSNTEIRFAKLKNDAGMIGALRNFLNKNPI